MKEVCSVATLNLIYHVKCIIKKANYILIPHIMAIYQYVSFIPLVIYECDISFGGNHFILFFF